MQGRPSIISDTRAGARRHWVSEHSANTANGGDDTETHASNDPTERQEIRFRRRGPLAEIILTREKALNALSLDMIRQSDSYLSAWAHNPAIQVVAVYGAGDKAFCAGGDVRAVWDAHQAGGELPRTYFRHEYTLNRRVRNFPKPYLALIDGATMGGGVGISVHGTHRIAGDRTVIAMPETAIGFIPDVGTTHVLSRLPGQIGMYMALTGARLGAADAVHAGLATHYVPSDEVLRIPDALVAVSGERDMTSVIDRILSEKATDPGPPPIAQHRGKIDACFAGDSVEAIVDALEQDGSDWANQTLATLHRMSPTSMKLTHAALRRAAHMDFDACLKMEYRLSQACMAGHDFHEGIRAVLVDKDKSPRWSPSRLQDVAERDVVAAFETLGANDLCFDEDV
jgi:enoyl-CoA hydratase